MFIVGETNNNDFHEYSFNYRIGISLQLLIQVGRLRFSVVTHASMQIPEEIEFSSDGI